MTDFGEWTGQRPTLRDRAVGLARDTSIPRPFSHSSEGIPAMDLFEEGILSHYKDLRPHRNGDEVTFQTLTGATASLTLTDRGEIHIQTNPTDTEATRGITAKGTEPMGALSIGMTLASVDPEVFERIFPGQREVLATALSPGQFETSRLEGRDGILTERYALVADGVRSLGQTQQRVTPKEVL